MAAGAVAAALGVTLAAAGLMTRHTPAPQATHAMTAEPTPSRTPATAHSGPPANPSAYDLSGLPAVDVFSVNPLIPVDPDPDGAMTDLDARPLSAAIPVFADPAGAPVAQLAQSPREGSGLVPVIAAYSDWVKVLLSGRQGVPPDGNSHQTYGWLRRADVGLSTNDTSVVVSLSQRTIDIVSPTGTARIATDFAWGTAATPTPIGRTFVMEVAVNPALSYTRGHPIVYLATQSPTLEGFDGQNVAVTAMHYYDAHSGAISNGCIRVDAQAIEALDQVPAGSVVYVRA
ncbi:hypothetical protein D7I44_05945 [Gryllotalpicola protaetiae]|uniref:L,D-TPase catalytic domain-containing protein n=1 Tax=Gryllotalpicola protaetiae TaxID=2419771 RepID=A0A387BQ12_9MICO|nr:hypothetical protein D7I44_05945 [Gryllotalpicola protaetiae]